MWTQMFQAHTADTKNSELAILVQRYQGAVYRYLWGAVRDPDAAEDLCQEFALRFVRGDFHRADPERGRFRDYLKAALIRLVIDYQRARQAWPKQVAGEAPEPAASSQEATFLDGWREELLDRLPVGRHDQRPDWFPVSMQFAAFPVARSQSLTNRSLPPVASRRPSAAIARPRIVEVCMFHRPIGSLIKSRSSAPFESFHAHQASLWDVTSRCPSGT